jgi:hypothetical protein
MLVSRPLIMQYQTPSSDSQQSSISFPRLFQQGKLISQIIAYIWLWADSSESEDKQQNAQKLAQYFKKPTKNTETGENLKKLFAAVPNPEGSEEDKLLYAVFPDLGSGEFPIFNDNERQFFSFDINVNDFQGTINDANLNGKLMTLSTPFPPCPKFSNATVTQDELKAWINDRNSDNVISDNPYIPTCTS